MEKLTKKELRAPDEIWKVSRKILDWLTDQMVLVTTLVGIIFVGMLVGVYLYQVHLKTEGLAQSHLAKAIAQYEQWKLESTAAKPDTIVNLKKELDTLSKEFGSTNANHLADFYRGELAASDKNWKDASADYESYVKRLKTTEKNLGLYPLAQSYEQAQDWPHALSTYERVLDSKPAAFVELGMLGKARSLQALNRGEDAKKIYQAFLDKYPSSTEVPTVRALLHLSN